MKTGTKVNVNLKSEDAKMLGINGAIQATGTIEGEYTNGVKGHFVNIGGKTVAIADKYNALQEV